jgi:hypothetical protein
MVDDLPVAAVVPHPSTANAMSDDALVAAVRAFIAAPVAEEFDGLARAVHRHQYRHNAPYRRFVDRVAPREPRTWRDIPAVSVEAFRDHVLACGPAARVFESSGTTQGIARRARHHVVHLDLYEAAATAGFDRAVLARGERRPFVVAAPEPDAYPSSSLAAMVGWLRRDHDAGGRPSFLRPDALDADGLQRAIATTDPGRPVLVLAVTSALLRLLDTTTEPATLRLPADSVIVDTGGCKGYGADLPRDAILERYRRAFGVSDEQVVNEYGMTELCSQLYARGNGPWTGAPWIRTLVCDPLTGAEQPPGIAGVLRHVDLANVGSVVAIQTEDVGRAVDGGIELLGRATAAETRGCSLLAAP